MGLCKYSKKIETINEDFPQLMFSCVYQWCKLMILLLEKNSVTFNFKTTHEKNRSKIKNTVSLW